MDGESASEVSWADLPDSRKSRFITRLDQG